MTVALTGFIRRCDFFFTGSIAAMAQALLGLTLELFYSGKSQIPPNLEKKCFSLYGSWEALDGCKILVQVVRSFCRPGKHHSGKNKIELFGVFLDGCAKKQAPALCEQIIGDMVVAGVLDAFSWKP